jgi:predicted RNase H-like HicB family nuclease
MKYLIIFEKTRTGYSAYLPDLPGCVATGRTKEQVEKNIREAIDLHLDGMKADGLASPQPESFAEYREVRE